jgi:hypothetical protein
MLEKYGFAVLVNYPKKMENEISMALWTSPLLPDHGLHLDTMRPSFLTYEMRK